MRQLTTLQVDIPNLLRENIKEGMIGGCFCSSEQTRRTRSGQK